MMLPAHAGNNFINGFETVNEQFMTYLMTILIMSLLKASLKVGNT